MPAICSEGRRWRGGDRRGAARPSCPAACRSDALGSRHAIESRMRSEDHS
jgi:hypothetical protein